MNELTQDDLVTLALHSSLLSLTLQEVEEDSGVYMCVMSYTVGQDQTIAEGILIGQHKKVRQWKRLDNAVNFLKGCVPSFKRYYVQLYRSENETVNEEGGFSF